MLLVHMLKITPIEQAGTEGLEGILVIAAGPHKNWPFLILIYAFNLLLPYCSCIILGIVPTPGWYCLLRTFSLNPGCGLTVRYRTRVFSSGQRNPTPTGFSIQNIPKGPYFPHNTRKTQGV